jgi:hypothetical protein
MKKDGMQIKTTEKLSTLRMPGEREKEYTAWLLYCESGSLEKTLRIWGKIWHQVVTDLSPVYRERLGKPASLRTLKRWCVKHKWIKRTRIKLDEDLKELHKETQKIAKLRIYKITKVFGIALDKKLKQLQQGEHISASDLKTCWEMHRIEMGLSTSIGRQEVISVINEDEQKPPTKEEMIASRFITEAEKKYNDYMLELESKKVKESKQ